jgi:hypothetical protein
VFLSLASGLALAVRRIGSAENSAQGWLPKTPHVNTLGGPLFGAGGRD